MRIWKLVLLLDPVILTVSGVLPLSLRYWMDLSTEILLVVFVQDYVTP